MWRALAITLCLAGPLDAQAFFTLKGHGGPIMGIAVSDTDRIATASFDNAVGLWDGERPRWLDGHRAAVNTVAFWDAETVVSGGDDFAVRLWSADGTQELGQHQGKVMGLAVSQAAGLVASASWDGTIGLWPVGGGPGRLMRGHGQGVNAVAFSADGQRLYSASTDGTIRLWDVVAGQETQLLATHGFGINRLILNEAEGWLAYGAVDGGTRLIDPQDGAQIADFSAERRPILALAFEDNEGLLAVGDGEGYIMVINTRSRRIVHDFRAAQKGPIWALAFSSNGQNIHAGGIEDRMYSWPLATMGEHDGMAGTPRSFLADPKTLPNGERQFKRKCSICHTVTEGSARKAGPSLYGVFGRPAGSVQDYFYSDTLRDSDIVWSAETINALFDEGPDHYIPGTKMPMQRIAQQKDRDDLIAYLRDATRTGRD